ncbi:MAG: hypothetical protein ATN36_08840 [Epulopiscium sp. Nele67-Bin005]|nr:MAG: hypothetical protein ATN36_08840 [Epulopiscium sp. Nele67-Bin005]
MYYLAGGTKEDLLASRKELFGTTVYTLRGYATMLKDVLDQNNYCVFGNLTSIDDNKHLLNTVVNV